MTVCVLAGLAALPACSRKSASGVSLNSGFRYLIPADTEALVDLQLEELRRTPLYKQHEKELDFPLLDDSSARFGIDPRRDISEVLIAWNGKRALFLARGSFDSAGVERKLISSGIPRGTYKNHQVFGDANNSLVSVNNGVAAIGSAADVHSAIDREDGKTGEIPEELQVRLRQMPKGYQLWIVSRGGLAFADMPMRSDMQLALSNIVNFITGATVGVAVDTGTHFRIDVTCISPQGAQRVHDAVRGGIGLARLTTKDDQLQLLQVYDAVNVDIDKEVVHVRADYSGQLTDKLLTQLRQMRGIGR